MAERSEFAVVVRERSAAWSRTAYLMCGDRSHAEDLLQAALLRLYLKWPRINLDGLRVSASAAPMASGASTPQRRQSPQRRPAPW